MADVVRVRLTVENVAVPSVRRDRRTTERYRSPIAGPGNHAVAFVQRHHDPVELLAAACRTTSRTSVANPAFSRIS